MSTNIDRKERMFAIGLVSALFVMLLNTIIYASFNALNKHLAISENYQFAHSIPDSFISNYVWTIVPSLILTCLLIFKVLQYLTLPRKSIVLYVTVFFIAVFILNYQSVDGYMFDQITELYDSLVLNDSFVHSKYFEPMQSAINNHDYIKLKELTNNPEILKFKK